MRSYWDNIHINHKILKTLSTNEAAWFSEQHFLWPNPGSALDCRGAGWLVEWQFR